jgi:hypothetical protein
MHPLTLNMCSNLVYGETLGVSIAVIGIFTFSAKGSYLAVFRQGADVSSTKMLAGTSQPAPQIGN